VLLLESDRERRSALVNMLYSRGISAVAVGSIAEIERWPVGDVVVTEAAYFSSWWSHIGATHVIVLAESSAIGADACSRGAAAWLSRRCPPAALLAVLEHYTRLPDAVIRTGDLAHDDVVLAR
jgi:hypothetical protein